MGSKTGTRLPSFCLNRIKPHVVRVRSPPTQAKIGAKNDAKNDQESESSSNVVEGEKKEDKLVEEKAKPATGLVMGRKIMIVVDSSCEAKGALQWALSHSVQSQDKVVLLHVISPPKQAKGEGSCKEIPPRAYGLVNSLKSMCQSKRPEVQIDVEVVEEKEKGVTIVNEARKQGVSLLVLGQRKRSTTWRLLLMWAASGRTVGGGGVVEYCIQNATCMAVAVRRKSKKVGGYLITTKRQKDFWLLA